MRKEVEWENDIGQQVRAYRNLKNGLISIQHYKKGKGWILSGHCDNCVLVNVSFKISESGRQRVLNLRKRNVHAFAIGKLIGKDSSDIYAPIRLGYDPYKCDYFYDKDSGRKLESADYLVVRNNEVLIRPIQVTNKSESFVQMALNLNLFTWTLIPPTGYYAAA
jgi:hypothetical protein